MTYRLLRIGSWRCHFFFAQYGYEEEDILDLLYDLDAPDDILVSVSRKMRAGRKNEGFTYSNQMTHDAVIVIGPTTSGAEFVNSLSHEIYHLSVAISKSLGLSLEGEGPAYIEGDTMGDLIRLICQFGCDSCN